MNLIRFYVVISCVIFLSACEENPTTPKESDDNIDTIVNYNEGDYQYDISLTVRRGIFQYENPTKGSPQEKINKLLLAEFADYEQWLLRNFRENAESENPNYRGELRANSQVLVNEPNFLSVINKIYVHNGEGASINKYGQNFKILPSGKVKEIKLSDLFETDKNWLDALLITAIEHIGKKYGESALWTNSIKKAQNEALKSGEMKSKYINSFALTKNDTIILIFESLSLMPNAYGMPTIEIPTKELKFYKGIK